MLNQITISGRLTATPTLQVKRLNDGQELRFLRFSIASQRDYKVSDVYPADFIDCVAWRGTAQFIAAHFDKGQEIIISGRLESNTYKNKDGENRRSVFINVDRAYFAGAKKTSEAVPNNASDEIPIPDDEYAPPLEAYLDESEL